MKTTILTSLLIAGTLLTAKAQTNVKIIGRAGLNFTNLNEKDGEGHKSSGNMKTGFHLGADFEIPIAEEFYFQPGAIFSTKGAKYNDANSPYGSMNFSYLEIPVSFMYKPALSGGRLILGAGPYAAIGLAAKAKADDFTYDLEFKNESTMAKYSDDPSIKRMDFGANFIAGYELSNGLSFQLNSQLGLANIYTKITDLPSQFDQPSVKNTGFGISVGYKF